MSAEVEAARARARRKLGSLAVNPDLDRWIVFRADGTVLVRTGKAELGQGIRTAIALAAADELGVDARQVVVEGPATGRAPNEGVTAGSGSIEQSGSAVRQACAHVRRILRDRAAGHLGVAVSDVTIADGVGRAGDGREVDLWVLAVGRPFATNVDEPTELAPASEHKWIGRGLPRLDLPAKLRGEAAFVHDLTLPGLRHARVIRPPRPGAVLVDLGGDVDLGPAELVRDGSFLAVVADREADAVAAADRVRSAVRWDGGDEIVAGSDGADHLEAHVVESTLVVDGLAAGDRPPPAPALDEGDGIIVEARYTKPFLLHGSIGPSAAVARFAGGRLHLWSHSQGVELLRLSVAEAVGLDPELVSADHVDGAGCYGHNGADDVALDAALVAMAHPERPVRCQWTRDDEHGWEPLSPAMSMRLGAVVDGAGCIRQWHHDVFSYSHGARPRPTGGASSGLLATWYTDVARERPSPQPSRGFHSGTHRNADPLYGMGAKRVVAHFVGGAPLRTSSTRGLGAFGNVFAIESFIDELASAAGADPVEFRLAHLQDERARAVVDAVVELAGGLEAPGGIDAPGRGIAFSRYENIKTYVAVIAEVEVVARTGEIRLTNGWIAADAGEVIDPDGLVNQLEGGFVQAASWALKEQVTFDAARGVTSRDWASYPILRFSEVPELTTRLLDRPDQRSLGAGEATTGPTPAAIANAVFQATGARLRDLPMRPERVRAALDALR